MHEKVKNYIEDIAVLERFKFNLSSLKIEWELDPDIDLSVLASEPKYPIVPGTVKTIKMFSIESVRNYSGNKSLFNPGEIERFLELYKLIEEGAKIIPPLFQTSINFINGIPQYNESGNVSVSDGDHRVRLAKYIGLKEIPVLFIEIPHNYSFSRSSFEIGGNDDIIEFMNKSTGEIFGYPADHCHFALSDDDYYSFFVL